MGEALPLDGLLGSRAGFLLSYPRYDDEEAGRRLEELRGLGIGALELLGRHVVEGVRVLGKGHVGVVVSALRDSRRVAVKIRRVDADRASLEAEAANLRVANQACVGPSFLGVSPNFLVMELVEGDYLVDWLGGLGPPDEGRLRRVLEVLLEKARRLDAMGLDHGELARADRHIMVVGDEPRIIDFESASTSRRCGNVTSVVHYLFFNRRMRGLMGRMRPLPGREGLLEALSRYKSEPTDGNFRRVLGACGLAAQGF